MAPSQARQRITRSIPYASMRIRLRHFSAGVLLVLSASSLHGRQFSSFLEQQEALYRNRLARLETR